MPKFTSSEEFAEVQIAVGGRAYAFADGKLEVPEESDAKRVRVFAFENPHLGIEEVISDPIPADDESGDGEDQDDNADSDDGSDDGSDAELQDDGAQDDSGDDSPADGDDSADDDGDEADDEDE